jgi:rubredoxin/flavin reductase (DIM6/NTAB) family NADH-FMN oxidoreductase RutF
MNYESFYKISYGLYIICTGNDKVRNGYIGNTAMQVTSAPPQIAICCSKENYSCELIRQIRKFSISVLNQDSKPEIMGTFGFRSSKNIDKLSTIEHFTGKSGVPVVTEDCNAWFECSIVSELDTGSHFLFIASIDDFDLTKPEAIPLTYAWYREKKNGFAPKNAPTYIDKNKIESNPSTEKKVRKYKCLVCGHIYNPEEGDPDSGIKPGTKFEEIPDDWICPLCGATKDMFEEIKN